MLFSVATLLEVGCGTGFVIQAIGRSNPHLKLYESELFSEGLHFAKLRSPTVEFMQLDARALPFRDSFDVIG
ncbi:MAG: class I SAM-dependent methyltransferase [Candidatus Obscuribacter sp.]|nr:class I SAM-dependent methyltransferase [Candidatus Obscuribacter sp.]